MAIPTKAFYAAFGEISYQYASAEFGIKALLGAMLDIHTLYALIIAEPYSSLALRNVAKSIAKTSRLEKQHQERFIWLVGQFGSFGPLRNAVAHNRWTAGMRPDALKPVAFDIRSGDIRIDGMHEGDRDWTAEELEAEAGKLRKLNRQLVEFKDASGLSGVIEAKDAETKAEIEASLGNSDSNC